MGTTALDTLRAELIRTGYAGYEPQMSGKIERFGEKRRNWFVGQDAGGIILAHWGDQVEKHTYISKDVLSDEETRLLGALGEEMERARRAEWEKASSEATRLWESFDALGTSGYLQRKGFTPDKMFRTRVSDGKTWACIQDVAGKIWSLQWIATDGTKGFMGGGRVAGCFHFIGNPPTGAAVVLVCEGVATGASLWEATRELQGTVSVVCAMMAGNLHAVVENLKSAGSAEIVICADNDATEVGQRKGRDAAARLGVKYAVPPTRGDFNDLHVGAGLELVTQILTATIAQGKELLRLEGHYTKAGKYIPPNEEALAIALKQHFGDTLLAQEGTIWQFKGTHWVECKDREVKLMKLGLMKLHGPDSTIRKIDGAYKNFLTRVGEVPKGIDFFTPSPFHANFENGTLYVKQNKAAGCFVLEFQEGHRRTDFLTSVLPHSFSWDWSEFNPEFDAMLERVFQGDADKDQKIHALSEMYGACLLPAFPHLFFLWGPGGTGKSTLIHLAKLLVDEANTCKVEPTALEGFNMESMVGKLVNYVTDVKITKPIEDAVLKRIVDRDKERVRRKGIRDVMAPLPPIHIFGGNKIPETMDGGSGAHDRRWTFIELRNSQLGSNGGNYDINYWSNMHAVSKKGFLNFALRGLKRLCDQGGHFTMPASGRREMKEWQLQSDPVGLFLSQISSEEGLELVEANSKLERVENGGITKPSLWESFKIWVEEETGKRHAVGRNTFFREVMRRGYVERKLPRGARYFVGTQLSVKTGSEF